MALVINDIVSGMLSSNLSKGNSLLMLCFMRMSCFGACAERAPFFPIHWNSGSAI